MKPARCLFRVPDYMSAAKYLGIPTQKKQVVDTEPVASRDHPPVTPTKTATNTTPQTPAGLQKPISWGEACGARYQNVSRPGVERSARNPVVRPFPVLSR